MDETVYNVGDWVRFYSDGELVIGVVEYISTDVLGGTILSTTVGTVTALRVLEQRRK